MACLLAPLSGVVPTDPPPSSSTQPSLHLHKSSYNKTDADRADSAYYKDFVAPKKDGHAHGHH